MGVLSKADFYYGALLSGLINSGFAPAIIEQAENRRLYNITANTGDFMIYSKYASEPLARQKKDVQLWQFVFVQDEIEMIRNFTENNKKYYFALICGKKEFKGSEVALLSLSDVRDCLDYDYTRDTYRITIRAEKGKHGLGAYGTGRADKLDGNDNTIRVPRDILTVFHKEQVS
ncbi:hypothetical protein NYE70_22095 [Paenibacillus sp. FSL R5-0407]|uniref:hypothetical protein n=1 Tax=unclassified Paenibacillus TaxID=185978 RepID=UPI000B928073|nr:hypothetical protein [Paenibacillus sp. RUD330]ASS69287.1 hypothetical protein CIC07_13190 [Paenibacillus sp. RUD330]